MTSRIIFLIACSCGILSCTTSADSGRSSADMSGVYVREFAYEISNPETGKKLGMRQVRDSIFIERTQNGYQVSNRKWRMNDYDQEGWVSMAHAEDRPLPAFLASYDETANALTPENAAIAPIIFVDREIGTLFTGRARKTSYHKID